MKRLYSLLCLVVVGAIMLNAPSSAPAGRTAGRTAAPTVSDTGAVLGPIGGIPAANSLVGLLALPTVLEPDGHGDLVAWLLSAGDSVPLEESMYGSERTVQWYGARP